MAPVFNFLLSMLNKLSSVTRYTYLFDDYIYIYIYIYIFNSYIALLYMTSQNALHLHVYMHYVYFTYSTQYFN